MSEQHHSFTCPRCGSVSQHPMDVLEAYCGHCHDWTEERPFAGRYYDRDGTRMSFRAWAEQFDDLGKKHVALTAIDDQVHVSTVWLGLDHRMLGNGPPLIFETLVFGGPMDDEMDRYATLERALAGHERMVEMVRVAAAVDAVERKEGGS